MAIWTRREPASIVAAPRHAILQRPTLTASAVPANARNATGLRRLNQLWQARALARYDDVGECWYPAQFYSRTMTRVRFFPAILDDKGDKQEVDTGQLADLWARVQDPGGGQTELTAAYGHLMFLNGDGYLMVSDDDGEEVWEYLSTVELRVQPDSGGRTTYRRIRAPGITPEELIEADDSDFEPVGNEARVYRLYRRHPAYSFWADAPVRAVLDLYDLLRMLTLAAHAESQSRAANRGLLFMPEELSFASPDSQAGEEDMRQDTFADDLIESYQHAIADPGSASAMAPNIIRGPGTVPTGIGTAVPTADLIKWLQAGPDDSYRAVEVAERVIGRIGNGLDLPGAIVTGEARNHWGDWLIDEQGFRQHVGPVCDRFGSDMTAAYLRPAARDAGIEDWERVCVGYDPAEAVNHPDEFASAKEMHDRLVISDQALREAGGYTDDDAPDDQELERRTFIKVSENPYGTVDAQLDPEGETAPADGGSGNDATEAPPDSETAAPEPVAASALLAERIRGASESHITRARSLAGSRLRNRSQGCETCQEDIGGVHPSAVAATLGSVRVREIIDGHTSEVALVAGAGRELAETLRRFGVEGDWPDELGRLVEAFSVKTLYEREPPPLPTGFSAVVAKAIAA